ncbi:MAG: response regulator [Bacteroidia bacterium]
MADFQVALAEQRTEIESASTDVLKSQAFNTYISVLIDGGWYNKAQEAVVEASALINMADCSKELAIHKANHALLKAYNGEVNSDQLFSEALYCAQNLKNEQAIGYVLYRMTQAAHHGGYFGTSFQHIFQLELYASPESTLNLHEVKLLEAYSLAYINKQDQAIQLLNTLTKLSPLSELKKNLWLSMLYLSKEDQLNVRICSEKVVLLATEINSPYWLIQSQYAYGKGIIAEKDFEDALEIYNQTTALVSELDHPITSAQELLFKIGFAKEQEDIATIVSLCSALVDDASLWAALSLGDKQQVYTSQKDAYLSTGNAEMAQNASRQLEALSKEAAANSSASHYEFLKKTLARSQNEKDNIAEQAENEINFQEQRTAQVLKYSALGALLVLSILLILLYRQIRIKQSANAELEERSSLINKQNQELRKMNSVLEESRQQAEAGSVAKSNFLAVTSHEIRTPMNGIMGMASLLLESKMDDEQRRYVETIQTSSENLLTILNDILDFSKIEAGKMNIETTMIDLNKLLDEVMIIFSKQAKDKNIELSKFIGNAMIKQFRGDVLRIRQVLINLVSNAIKFTENGTVKILVELDELLKAQSKDSRIAKLKFSVIDDGIGISEEKQKKIFESFEQEDSSTSRKYGGIGLGLSISKKLVELMGGEIGLSSEKGRGTSFYFTLNVEIPNSASKKTIPLNHREDGTETPVVQEPISVKHPLKILLAEDNPFNKLFIDKLFEKFGYTDYLHAENGIEVLEILENNPVDLILMDIQMPEMDGLEATQKIIERYGNGRPVIIALTADANDSSKDQYLNAGMDGFLSKPFKAEALQQLLIEQSDKIKAPA